MNDHQAGFIDRGNSEGYFAFKWSPAAADFLEKHRFKKLEFSGAWGDFGFIAKYADFVESLLLSNRDGRADGVSTLHNLRELIVLAKPRKPIDFSGLKKLEKCLISWDKSYSSTLFALPSLKDVRVQSFADTDFRGIAPNPSVEELELIRPHIESLQGLGAFENLRKLELAYASKLSSFGGIEQMKKLAQIRIINAQKLSHIPSLVALKDLEVLVLGNVSLPNLDFAYGSERLTLLSVGGEPVEVDWTKLFSLPRLKHLQVLVSKEGCPTEEQFRTLLAASGREAESMELYSTRKSNWVSVQIKCTTPTL